MSNQGPTSKLSHGLQPRLMKDWDSVRLNLKQVFQSLAEIKADMTIGDSDAAESEQFTWAASLFDLDRNLPGLSHCKSQQDPRKNP